MDNTPTSDSSLRFFIRFSYRGTAYHGSQRQPNGITVQEAMEDAFATLFRCPIPLTFAGRTDAGVHARVMYAHFDLPQPLFDCRVLVARLNSLLPSDIAVSEVRPVTPDAHARFSALARTYEYHVHTGKNPFLEELSVPVGSLDYTAMNSAATHLLGEHDCASFCRAHTDVKTTLCTISRADWQLLEQDADGQPRRAVFTITANRFLRNMVRAVVGTLFEVGRGRMTEQHFLDVLQACSREAAGQSADPQGLYLTDIVYPASIFTL